jgi:septal ring factor EnvC (AmiA/AmiB activator)
MAENESDTIKKTPRDQDDHIALEEFKKRSHEYSMAHNLSLWTSIIGLATLLACIPFLLRTPLDALLGQLVAIDSVKRDYVAETERVALDVERLNKQKASKSKEQENLEKAIVEDQKKYDEAAKQLILADPSNDVGPLLAYSPLKILLQPPKTGYSAIEGKIASIKDDYVKFAEERKAKSPTTGPATAPPAAPSSYALMEQFVAPIVDKAVMQYQERLDPFMSAMYAWRREFASGEENPDSTDLIRKYIVNEFPLPGLRKSSSESDLSNLKTAAAMDLAESIRSRNLPQLLGIVPPSSAGPIISNPDFVNESQKKKYGDVASGKGFSSGDLDVLTAQRVWLDLLKMIDATYPGVSTRVSRSYNMWGPAPPAPPAPVAPNVEIGSPPRNAGTSRAPVESIPSPPPQPSNRAPAVPQASGLPGRPATPAPAPPPFPKRGEVVEEGSAPPVQVAGTPKLNAESEQKAELVAKALYEEFRTLMEPFTEYLEKNKAEIESYRRASRELWSQSESIRESGRHIDYLVMTLLRYRLGDRRALLRDPIFYDNSGYSGLTEREILSEIKRVFESLDFATASTESSLRQQIATHSKVSKALLDSQKESLKKQKDELDAAENRRVVAEKELATIDSSLYELESRNRELKSKIASQDELAAQVKAMDKSAQASWTNQPAVIGALAAAICQVVSGLIFVVAMRAQTSLAQSTEQVQRNLNFREALELTRLVHDPAERDRVRSTILCSLAGTSAPLTPAKPKT